MSIFVLKRNGKKEEFNIDKINKIVKWAVDGIKDVSLSDIEINSKINIRDGISSSEIHKVLIESAANLISLETPNYQYVAARLLSYELRKSVWGGKNAPKLIDLIKKNIELGVYTPEILQFYTEKEINKIDEFIDHDRDFIFTYAGIKQLIDKYLVQNRKTKEVYETPQFAYALIAAVAFANYPKESRMEYVRRAYNYFSKHKINLPTPIMAGVRGPMKSFASCLLTNVDDTMESIFANVSVIGHATAKRYGIGFNTAHIRALNAPIRNGDVIHTGKIPFLKVFEAAVKSSQQSGLRGGSATVTNFIFDYDVESLLVLKNNSGTEENRIRKLDYSFGFSKLFYERWLKDQPMTLFSSHECRDLFEAFGTPAFDDLYVKYEADETLKFKRIVSTRDIFDLFVKESIETGRNYLINVDHANDHSPWLDTVQMSNLCVAPETLLLTKGGQKEISSLEGQEVEVWNGHEWSKTTVVKTGENQKLLTVKLFDGTKLECTEYHKFYLSDDYEIRAKDLLPGSCMKGYVWSSQTDFSEVDKFVYSITDEGRKSDTYCVNEPIRHRAVFNGILTGQCQEVIMPVIAPKSYEDKDAEIGICILAAINWLEVSESEMEKVCDVTVRMLDEIIDYQEYFCPAAENFATKRRSLGVGITNLAALLAKNSLKYQDPEAANFVAKWMERQQYYLIKSSVELAKEKGKCEKFDRTKYSLGLLPIDHYKKDKVDVVITQPLEMDWAGLREEILKHGMRHSTLSACMPAESCLKWDEKIKTHAGYKNFHEILEEGGLSASEIEDEHLIGWHVLDNEVSIPTKDGDKTFEKVYYNGRARLYEIEFENGAVVKSTGSHKFFGKSGKWIQASNLQAGDEIVYFSQGELPAPFLLRVTKASITDETAPTYDIEVEDTHNYLIKCGDVDLVSHNSSVIQNSTNGIEPIRSLIIYKKSKASTVPVLAPNVTAWKNRYTLAFDMQDNIGYMNIAAAIQKFCDMAISINMYYDYKHYEDKKIPHSKVIKEMLYHYSVGGKTRYYLNTNDGDREQMMDAAEDEKVVEEEDMSCASGSCSI